MVKLQTKLFELDREVNALKKQISVLSKNEGSMSKGGEEPTQALGGVKATEGKVYAARVNGVADAKKGGNIIVTCPEINGDKTFSVKMAAPFGGAGYGFFAVPGEGALVLITKTAHGWVWFSCVYEPTIEPGGKPIITQPRGKGSEAQKREDEDHLAKRGREEGDPMQRTRGIPEGFLAYEGNQLPEQYIWKTPKGNKIIMSEKHTSENEEKHITIQTPGGKRIILDDADPRTEVGTEPSVPYHQTGDRIIIADGDEWEEEGGPNRIWIQSTAGAAGVEDSIQVYARNSLFLEAREGNINMTVLDSDVEDAHILITNLASGNLEIDIEEGDIAAAAKYRICMNAWNENEEDGPLGSIGMRSKGKFQIKNGINEPTMQNIQMVSERNQMVLNSGRAGLILLGDNNLGKFIAKTDYMTLTAQERILISGKHVVIEGEVVEINKGTYESGPLGDRYFNNTADLPFADQTLEPCFDLEDDKDIDFGGGATVGEPNPDLTEGEGEGGEQEELTTEDDETDDYIDGLIDGVHANLGIPWGEGVPPRPGDGFPPPPGNGGGAGGGGGGQPPVPGTPVTPTTPTIPTPPLPPDSSAITPITPTAPVPPVPPPTTSPTTPTTPTAPTTPPSPPRPFTPTTPTTPTLPPSGPPTPVTLGISPTTPGYGVDRQPITQETFDDSDGGGGGGGGIGLPGRDDPIRLDTGGGGDYVTERIKPPGGGAMQDFIDRGSGGGGGSDTYQADRIDPPGGGATRDEWMQSQGDDGGIGDGTLDWSTSKLPNQTQIKQGKLDDSMTGGNQNSSFPGGTPGYRAASPSRRGEGITPPPTLQTLPDLTRSQPPMPAIYAPPSRGAESAEQRTGSKAYKVYGEPGYVVAAPSISADSTRVTAEDAGSGYTDAGGSAGPLGGGS